MTWRVTGSGGSPSVPAPRLIVPHYGVGAPFVQGPPGRDGRDGVDGVSPPAFPGFGQITYTHTTTLPGDRLEANTPTLLTFTPDGTPQDYLLGVFEGHQFWDGTKIIPRAMYDLIEAQINIQVSSQIDGGFIQVYLDAKSPLGPIVSSTATLFSAANVLERVTFLLNFQVLSYIMQNGGSLYLRSTVPLYVIKETLLIMPRSTQG